MSLSWMLLKVYITVLRQHVTSFTQFRRGMRTLKIHWHFPHHVFEKAVGSVWHTHLCMPALLHVYTSLLSYLQCSSIPLQPSPLCTSWHACLICLLPLVAQFMYIIRRRISLPSEKAMFLFVNKVLPTTRQVLCNFLACIVHDTGRCYATDCLVSLVKYRNASSEKIASLFPHC